MPSPTEIANMAFAKIGQAPIDDIDDTSDNVARDAKLVYEDIVREVLRSHPWNCLKTRAVLAVNTAAPSFGWSYSYTLPSQCLRVCTVNGYSTTSSYVQDYFEIESRDILTDADECKITYIQYSADTTKYDPLLIQAIVLKLGAHLALKTAKDPQLAMALIQEYDKVTLPTAQRVDGNERYPRETTNASRSSWVRSRYYSTG